VPSPSSQLNDFHRSPPINFYHIFFFFFGKSSESFVSELWTSWWLKKRRIEMFDTWRAVFLLRKKNRKKKRVRQSRAVSCLIFASFGWQVKNGVMGWWKTHTRSRGISLSLCPPDPRLRRGSNGMARQHLRTWNGKEKINKNLKHARTVRSDLISSTEK
jgi:hypothetical protein